MSSEDPSRFVPTQFHCPITGEIMKDPVSTVDGHTYERSAITEWLKEHDTSPKTNLVLSSKQLVPNHSLKQMIQENEEDQLKVASTAQMPLSLPGPKGMGTSISKLGECFRVMDKLRIVLDQSTKNWSPPSFLVFGDEDVGKSTLLNRIVGRPILPTGSGVCTRVAIAVRLRRAAEDTAYMWLSKDCAVNEERPYSGVLGTVTNFFGLGGKSMQLDTKRNLALVVRNAMNEILSSQVSVTGVSTEHFIVLELNGPQYPNLDLIDLPGMTREGERKLPSKTLTEMFIQKHKGRSVLLGVMAASSAPNLTTAMEIVGNLNLYSTTIGVLTKCDEVADSGLKKKLVDVVEGSSTAATKLDFGYFATMLDTRVNPDEDAWFASKNEVIATILQAKRTGVGNLLDSMNELFLKYIAKNWIPNTLKLLEEARERLERETRILGLPKVPTKEQAQFEVRRCIALAIENNQCFAKFKADLDATWRSTTSLRGPPASNSAAISRENLKLCSDRIAVGNSGLVAPWANVLAAVTKLVKDLQGTIVKMVEEQLTKESEMQLKRFPQIIASTSTLIAEALEKSRRANFDPWLVDIIKTLQSMEFFTSISHETQVEKLYERTLGFVGGANLWELDVKPKGEQLKETCKTERDALEKELDDVARALKELKKLGDIAT